MRAYEAHRQVHRSPPLRTQARRRRRERRSPRRLPPRLARGFRAILHLQLRVHAPDDEGLCHRRREGSHQRLRERQVSAPRHHLRRAPPLRLSELHFFHRPHVLGRVEVHSLRAPPLRRPLQPPRFRAHARDPPLGLAQPRGPYGFRGREHVFDLQDGGEAPVNRGVRRAIHDEGERVVRSDRALQRGGDERVPAGAEPPLLRLQIGHKRPAERHIRRRLGRDCGGRAEGVLRRGAGEDDGCVHGRSSGEEQKGRGS